MAMQYSVLAAYYDRIMEDVDYGEWCDFYKTCFEKYSDGVHKVLDIACGTGNITLPLVRMGYETVGIDASEEMLALCESKIERSDRPHICLSEQNMALFDAGKEFDAAICSFDGYNYLTSPKEVLSSFASVYEALRDGGLFIFDVTTPYKYEHILADNAFVYEYDDMFLSWQNYYRKNAGLCDFYLTFFVKNGRHWDRIDETQRQRRYPIKRLHKMLAEVGFTVLDTVSDFAFSPLAKDSERAFILCRKDPKASLSE